MDTRTVCLGILSKGEASGYEIKKHLEEGPFGHFLDASFGSIYPALARLAGDGLVEMRSERASEGGRPKKLYALTEAGRAALREAVAHFPAPDRFRSEFLFQMILGDLLSPEERTRKIDHQIAHLRVKLEQIETRPDCARHGCQGFVAGLAQAMLGAALGYLESHRAGDPRSTPQPREAAE